ncbi:hypothetical protein AOLI_G00112760 [Acnodon oligacanthus]
MLTNVYVVLFTSIVVAVLGVTVEQSQLSWTKKQSKRAYISCKVTGLTTTYVHWYHQKDGEALKRILYVNKAGTTRVSEANDFTVELENSNDYVLRIDAVKLSHSGVYYCACWESGRHIAVLGLTVEQNQLFWMKQVGKSVYISCKVTDLTTEYIHWYQQKDGEALKRILYIQYEETRPIYDPIYPQAREFGVKVDKKSDAYDLKLIFLLILLIFIISAAIMYWVLFSSPVDSAVKLHQKFLMTKAATKTAIIECTFPSDCWSYIHWYQKKDNETLKRVQYVGISDGATENDPGFEFLKSEKKADDQFVLKIPNLNTEHSATYYCACWDWSDTVREQAEILHKNYCMLSQIPPDLTDLHLLHFSFLIEG